MNRKITMLILGVLLIGIVSALVVPYLSNTIVGTVSVSGPVFYAASENRLLLNEPEENTTYYNINNSDDEKFWSERFDESLDFYPMEIEMQVRARVTEGNLSKKMFLEFGYMRDDDRDNICRKEIIINSRDFEIYTKPCTRKTKLKNIDGFYYIIEGMGTEGVEYEVQVGDAGTKVEIDKYE